MKNYDVVLFDLDGTLLDTSEGIFNGADFMADQMGLERADLETKRSFIGPPIPECYEKHYGLTGEPLLKAIALYRDYYAREGYKEAKVYDGVRPLLDLLHTKGIKTGVATMKRHDMAIKCLEEAKLSDQFDFILGNTDMNSVSKATLVEEGLKALDISKDKAVLIGDTLIDAQGAYEAGVDFIQALYGFGLSNDKEQNQYPFVYQSKDASDLLPYFKD